MKNIILLTIVLVLGIQGIAQDKRVQFIIETPFGNMKGELYNETPQHRDNFVKLVNEGWYNDSPFHRIIKQFMIQGGQNADGRRDPGYKIPAEIMPGKYIHKKGALAAARMGDQVNPQKESSGSQFYICQGKLTNDQMLDRFEMQINQGKKKSQILEFVKRPENKDILQKLGSLEKARKHNELNAYVNQIVQLMAAEGIIIDTFKYSEKQRAVYRTLGGTPHLDGGYTVFGEITEGFDIIDKIAVVPTKAGDVPVEPISMQIRIIE